MPAPYKAGGDQFCIDTKAPGFDNTLKYQQFYSRTGCQLECRRDFIVNNCGCRAVTDPGKRHLISRLTLPHINMYHACVMLSQMYSQVVV